MGLTAHSCGVLLVLSSLRHLLLAQMNHGLIGRSADKGEFEGLRLQVNGAGIWSLRLVHFFLQIFYILALQLRRLSLVYWISSRIDIRLRVCREHWESINATLLLPVRQPCRECLRCYIVSLRLPFGDSDAATKQACVILGVHDLFASTTLRIVMRLVKRRRALDRLTNVSCLSQWLLSNLITFIGYISGNPWALILFLAQEGLTHTLGVQV